MSIGEDYLLVTKTRFRSYKLLAEKAIAQIPEEKLFFQFNEDSNSIAMIMHHMAGNMLSRWTDFLTTDGEKEWRKRDEEFEPMANDTVKLMELWEKGWTCFFTAIEELIEEDLEKTVYIRAEPLTVIDAINRQLAHYSYHIGQIVFAAKILKTGDWDSLSIPRRK